MRQGDPGGSLYVIKSGIVRLMKESETGQIISVGELGAGEFFGEMSLLTGEPRLLSVLAQIDAEVVVVDKAAWRRCWLPTKRSSKHSRWHWRRAPDRPPNGWHWRPSRVPIKRNRNRRRCAIG